jgi:hypothetical protein
MQMLYRQAHGAIQARRWQNAIELLVQVKAIESGYRETERLLELSRAELEKEQTHASEQSAAPTPIPTTPPVSARFADASGERVTPGIRTSNSGKPVNLWLLIGLGGSGLVFLAIAVLFLIGILPPSVPPIPPTITPSPTSTKTPTRTPTQTPTLTPEPALVGGVPDITNTPTPTPTSTPTLTLMPELNLTYRVQCVADGLFWNAGGVGGDNLLSTRNLPNVNFTDMFIFELQEDGSYRINVVGTGLYLHEDGLDTLLIDQIDETDDFTLFYLEPQEDGIYRIRVKASGRYLHYDGLGDKLISTRAQEDDQYTWFRLVAAGE